MLLAVNANAQRSQRYLTALPEMEQALLLHDAGLYGAARVAFQRVIDNYNDQQLLSTLLEDAQFYAALDAKLQQSPDALNQLADFQQFNQNSKHRAEALYHIADIYLHAGDEKTALPILDRIKETDVKSDLRSHLLFKRGYCYFVTGDHNKALAQFDKMNGREGEYASAINYYRAHVDYENGNYDRALERFNTLSQDPGFDRAASYYIAQILYTKKRYEEALRYAEPLSQESGGKSAEMTRVVADCHFMLAHDAQALKAYEALADKLKGGLIRADYYHIGMAAFRQGDYKRAEDNLSRVTATADDMAQNAYYNLAVCALNRGDKKKARTAFEAAAKYDFDKTIKSDAEFNKLKLAYELSFSPFDDIVAGLTNFLKTWPDTPHRDEAYALIGKALVTTKNYPKALEALESIQHKDLNINRALQRIAFYHALSLYSNKNYPDCQAMLVRSLKYGDYDQRLKARALYWQGAALYADRQREAARDKLLLFMQAYECSEVEEFPAAHYDIAYTYYNGKQYEDARRWFLRYTSLAGDKPKNLLADAYNRLGDCCYLQRDFSGAEGYYDKALGTNRAQGDYSMLQKAICQGLRGDYPAKIQQLEQMLKDYPKSLWADNAFFEKARAHVALNQIPEAIYNYKVVKERYPKGALASQAMLQLGLLYYNNGELDNSLAFYKRVINEYPSTPEAMDALGGLRNVFMERGDYDGYIAYTATLGSFAHVGMQERDSLLFVAASNQYLKGNAEGAKPGFLRYLETFPEGRYVTPANFYLAECDYADGTLDDALQRYQLVAQQPRSIFTEDALLRGGELLYKADRYAEALAMLQRLEDEAEVEANKVEAIIGQMRCQSKLADVEGIIAGCGKVLDMPQATPAIRREALWLKASTLLQANRANEATPLLSDLAQNTHTPEGAQAKYLIAQLLFDKGDLTAAEKVIFEYVDQGSSNQYWLARSFVLLADIYHAQGDDFQAAQYLANLRETFSDDAIERLIAQREAAWNLHAEPADNNPSFDNEVEATPIGSATLPE